MRSVWSAIAYLLWCTSLQLPLLAAQEFGLQGLLLQLAQVWYGPHLKGQSAFSTQLLGCCYWSGAAALQVSHNVLGICCSSCWPCTAILARIMHGCILCACMHSCAHILLPSEPVVPCTVCKHSTAAGTCLHATFCLAGKLDLLAHQTSPTTFLLIQPIAYMLCTHMLPSPAGKCVPFDWVSFCAMLMHGRFEGLLKVERRQLWVGESDASVLVLVDPSEPHLVACFVTFGCLLLGLPCCPIDAQCDDVWRVGPGAA